MSTKNVEPLRPHAYPTAELRFIERDGKRILQQSWATHNGAISSTVSEWRDVPLVNP